VGSGVWWWAVIVLLGFLSGGGDGLLLLLVVRLGSFPFVSLRDCIEGDDCIWKGVVVMIGMIDGWWGVWRREVMSG